MNFQRLFGLTVFFAFATIALSLLCSSPLNAGAAPAVMPMGKAEIETVQPPQTAAEDAAKPTEIPQTANPPMPPIDILPAKTAETKGIFYNTEEITHPQIEMTPDKSEIIRLEGEAVSIVVGNPRHLEILAESAKLLILVPREPGATYFTALDAQGNVLMQRHVIIASPKEKYVRVRRSCVGSKNENCQETSVYYCPDMCHRILLADPESQPDAAPAGSLGAQTQQTDQAQDAEAPPSSE